MKQQLESMQHRCQIIIEQVDRTGPAVLTVQICMYVTRSHQAFAVECLRRCHICLFCSVLSSPWFSRKKKDGEESSEAQIPIDYGESAPAHMAESNFEV